MAAAYIQSEGGWIVRWSIHPVKFFTVLLTNLDVRHSDYKSHIIEEMQFAWCQVLGLSTTTLGATKWILEFCSTDPAPMIKYFDWATPPPVLSNDNPL